MPSALLSSFQKTKKNPRIADRAMQILWVWIGGVTNNQYSLVRDRLPLRHAAKLGWRQTNAKNFATVKKHLHRRVTTTPTSNQFRRPRSQFIFSPNQLFPFLSRWPFETFSTQGSVFTLLRPPTFQPNSPLQPPAHIERHSRRLLGFSSGFFGATFQRIVALFVR